MYQTCEGNKTVMLVKESRLSRIFRKSRAGTSLHLAMLGWSFLTGKEAEVFGFEHLSTGTCETIQ